MLSASSPTATTPQGERPDSELSAHASFFSGWPSGRLRFAGSARPVEAAAATTATARDCGTPRDRLATWLVEVSDSE